MSARFRSTLPAGIWSSIDELYALIKRIQGGQSGGGEPTFPATKTSNYTLAPTDLVTRADVSGGQFTISFEPNPTIGTFHTVKVVAGNAGATPLLISGNGNQIENPNNLGNWTSGTVALTSLGASVTWYFDGSRWDIVSSA